MSKDGGCCIENQPNSMTCGESVDTSLQKRTTFPRHDREFIHYHQAKVSLNPALSMEDHINHDPIYKYGCFDNPWKTWRYPSKRQLFKFFRERKMERFPQDVKMQKKDLPLHEWGDTTPNEVENPPKDKIQATWIGHATVLVQMDSINILTDPMFSDRCSSLSFIGDKRYQQTPCQIKDLPNIHAVVISHNHYDHLDVKSVKELNRNNPEIRWYVPLKMKPFMKSCGCRHVEELTWWEEKEYDKENAKIKFVLTPAQHWSQRGLFDSMKVLWGSWCVIGPKHRFYFAGDTGYCSCFSKIGDIYGPFDLAAIPIGAYYPRWYQKPQHIDPEEAVQIHMDLKAKQSIAIHWGTFALGGEPYMEPKELLQKAVSNVELTQGNFKTVEHGKAMTFQEGDDKTYSTIEDETKLHKQRKHIERNSNHENIYFENIRLDKVNNNSEWGSQNLEHIKDMLNLFE